MPCIANALVVGGGIGGLATAIALRQIGVQCDVLEIERKAVGAGIGFAGRAPQALEELGVYEETYATGKPFTSAQKAPVMRDTAGNVLHAPAPPQKFPGSRPPVGVHRPTFADILTRRAEALGARIEYGVTVNAIENLESAVKVTLTNGEIREYDCLIGADGIFSTVRELVFPDADEPEYCGQMSFRWIAPYPLIEEEDWYCAGDIGKVGLHNQPVQQNIYVPVVLNMPETRLSQAECYDLMMEHLGLYTAPAVVEIRNRLTPDIDIIPRAFKSHLVKSPWHRGRTVLLGDAAHATSAHMGMGGGMALEDAVVLADCIKSEATLSEALDRFMARRFDRVRTVVETSIALSKLEQAGINSGPENAKLMSEGMATLAAPY